MEYMKFSKDEKRIYIKLLLASYIYVLPIILADRLYNDDLARALYGATGWKGDGRPLGEYIFWGLCEGLPVVDMAPLPLILAILLLCYSLILYARVNLGFMNCDRQLIVLLFILVNPFALTNLSYQFDCVIMYSALSFNFLAYSISNRSKKFSVFCISIIFGIMIMASYQPAIGMSISLFLINVYFSLVKKTKNVYTEFVRIVGIFLGALIYLVAIAPNVVSQVDWRYEASRVITDLSFTSIKIVLFNIMKSCQYILTYFTSRSIVCKTIWGIMLASAFFSIIMYGLKVAKDYGIVKKIGYSILLVSFPGAIFISTFLPLVVLSNLDIKSRVLISFGAFGMFLGMVLFEHIKKDKLIFILLVACIFYQYTYMFIYGNAMASQKEYETYVAYNLASDIETINNNADYNTISFVGNMPKSRQLRMICDKNSFFEETVPIYFGNSTWIEGVWLYYYLQEDLEITDYCEDDMAVIYSQASVVTNSLYSCYVNGDRILIVFNELE